MCNVHFHRKKKKSKCKIDFSWNPSKCICENSKYLKSIADTSVTQCDKIIIVMDVSSTMQGNAIATNSTNTIATNVMSTVSVNYHKLQSVFYIQFY